MWFEKEIAGIRCDTTDCEPEHPLLVGVDSKMVPISHIFLSMMTVTYCFWLRLNYKIHMRILQPKSHPLFVTDSFKSRGYGLQL